MTIERMQAIKKAKEIRNQFDKDTETNGGIPDFKFIDTFVEKQGKNKHLLAEVLGEFFSARIGVDPKDFYHLFEGDISSEVVYFTKNPRHIKFLYRGNVPYLVSKMINKSTDTDMCYELVRGHGRKDFTIKEHQLEKAFLLSVGRGFQHVKNPTKIMWLLHEKKGFANSFRQYKKKDFTRCPKEVFNNLVGKHPEIKYSTKNR